MRGLFAVAGALSGAVSVAAGAFGAHALRGSLEPRAIEVFETAVRWQAVHALALLAVAVALSADEGGSRRRLLRAAGWSFLSGSVVFCGSLYALALTGLRALGAVAPVGGAAFVAGWLALALSARPRPRPEGPSASAGG